MTSIFLAGAENLDHQAILRECGATKVAVNVGSLLRRRASWELDFPYDYEWVAYSDSEVSMDDLRAVTHKASRPPSFVVGAPEWEDGEYEYLPLWSGLGEPPVGSNGLVVTDRVFKDQSLSRRALGGRKSGMTLGVITGSTDRGIGKFDFVISGAWWSVMKFGETQVWAKNKFNRLSAANKIEVRVKYASDIEALGINVEEVIAEEPSEVARLAVVSWQEYEKHLTPGSSAPRGKLQATMDTPSTLAEAGSGSQTLAIGGLVGRHEQVPLPTMGIETVTAKYRLGDGSEVTEDTPIVTSSDTSLRSCDNCFLASSGCPGFAPGASCAYSIPVQIKSKEQLQYVMQAVVEIQTQRVLQARFAEEVSGQELSPEFGKEADRLFRIVEKMRDITDTRDTVRVSVEAKSGAGVLSRLFGTDVGNNARALPTPVESEEVIDALTEGEDF